MAGSKRWFGYESDDALQYAVQLDESIYENVLLGFGVVASAALPIYATGRLPFSLRYINVARVEAGATIRARFYVGTPAAATILKGVGAITIDGVEWSITSLKGEQAVIIPAKDTAQLDGDEDDNFASA